MKATFSLSSFVVLTILLSDSAALAQSQPQTKPTAAAGQGFAAVDKNRDGKVDAAERAGALGEWRQRWMDEQKRRGQAAAEARKAAIAEHYRQQKVSPQLLEHYDRNKNGQMEPHEWEQFRQDVAKLKK